jgi:ATP dependent DNA ligase domain
MLLRPGGIPTGPGWAFELKWDGFRAIVSTERGLEGRSRRGWNMTARVPGLSDLPAGPVLDGEIVSFNQQGAPHWPLVVERVLHGNTAIPITFVVFDMLRVDGHDVTCNPWSQRRALLEGVWQERSCARLADERRERRVLLRRRAVRRVPDVQLPRHQLLGDSSLGRGHHGTHRQPHPVAGCKRGGLEQQRCDRDLELDRRRWFRYRHDGLRHQFSLVR